MNRHFLAVTFPIKKENRGCSTPNHKKLSKVYSNDLRYRDTAGPDGKENIKKPLDLPSSPKCVFLSPLLDEERGDLDLEIHLLKQLGDCHDHLKPATLLGRRS